MPLKKKETSSRGYTRTLSLIFYALLAGQLIFAAVVLFLVLPGAPPDNTNLFLLLVVALATSIGGVLIGEYLFKRSVKSRIRASFREKIENYRTAFIIRMATLEGPALLTIICVMLTGNPYFFILTFLLILVQFKYQPTVHRIAGHLKLDFKEKSRLN